MTMEKPGWKLAWEEPTGLIPTPWLIWILRGHTAVNRQKNGRLTQGFPGSSDKNAAYNEGYSDLKSYKSRYPLSYFLKANRGIDNDRSQREIYFSFYSGFPERKRIDSSGIKG